MKLLKFVYLIFIISTIFLSTSFAQSSQDTQIEEAEITKVSYLESTIENQVSKIINIEAKGLSGSIKNKNISFSQSLVASVDQNIYKSGDQVYLSVINENGNIHYGISDFIRKDNQLILFTIFFIVLLLIGGFKGLRSLIGLIVSLMIIIFFILPNILNGVDPLFISLVGASIILFPTVYLVHGLNRKSTIAITGAIISLIIAAILSVIFSQTGKITGVGNDDALYLLLGGNTKIKAQGLFIAAIIIGTLGVLIDMTVGQSSAISEIHSANPTLTRKQLYLSVMNVGRDHIGLLVNTLFLTYAGASLPILISFTQSKQSILYNLSQESTAMEIIRSVIGSLALILAVPITTIIGVYSIKKTRD